MGKIITIAAQKGGSGKTTTAISLSAYLAKKGKKILFIDLDGQCNSSLNLFPKYIEVNEKLKPSDTIAAILSDDEVNLKIYKSKVENIDIVPSHSQLSKGNTLLMQLMEKERKLNNALNSIKNEYDYIVIDCPPDINELPTNALVASDYVIIPVNPSRYDIQGLVFLFEKILQIQNKINKDLKILGLLLVMRDQTNISKDVFEKLKLRYGNRVFSTQIPRNVAIREAEGKLTNIFMYSQFSPSALAYTKWIETEVLPILDMSK